MIPHGPCVFSAQTNPPACTITELSELLKWLQAGLFISLLVVASIMDCRKRVIPNTVCVLMFIVGLLSFKPVHLLGALTGVPLLAAAIYKFGSMGGGDIKFVAATGVVLGPWHGLYGLCLGLLLAIIFYYAKWVLWRIYHRCLLLPTQASLPLAPFLSIGFAIVFLCNL